MFEGMTLRARRGPEATEGIRRGVLGHPPRKGIARVKGVGGLTLAAIRKAAGEQAHSHKQKDPKKRSKRKETA